MKTYSSQENKMEITETMGTKKKYVLAAIAQESIGWTHKKD